MNETKTNWDVLAGTRFVLAIIVFLYHIERFVTPNALTRFVSAFGGFSAVLGFFLISGYSIRNSITTKKEGYLTRRFYRIWPCYFAAFVLSMLPYVITGAVILEAPRDTAMAPTIPQFFGNLLMLQQNFVHRLEVNGAPWSLAIEETYYLLALGLVLLPRRWTWRVLAVSFVCYMALPYVKSSWGVWADTIGPYFTISLFWCWLLGWLLHEKPDCELTKLLVIGLPIVAISVFSNDSTHSPYLSVTLLASSLVLVHARRIQIAPRVGAVMRYLGDISYPLYISHMAVFWIVTVLGFTHPLWFFVTPFAVAVAMYHVIDRPMRHRYKTTKHSFAAAPVSSTN